MWAGLLALTLSIGMAFVIIGIGIVGLAAGNIMNSPEPAKTKAP